MDSGEIKDILIQAFTDDPINWLKWILVFATIVCGYIFIFPIYKKANYYLSYDRKRDIAKSKNHVIKASIISSFPTGEIAKYDYRAKYEYEINGKIKHYHAFFKHPTSPPRILYLYYINNPRKLFSVSEYHLKYNKGIVLLLLNATPWILAAFMLWVLKIDISGFQ
ncbi:MAG: hypothetical protein R3Y35_14545 [Clostridia bacterium]